ncbi:MAG: hypothetical protein QOI83_3817 [Streptomycetaceae bacterium]|nr:hypothetical protein [Streptomycetaceae bacterium]
MAQPGSGAPHRRSQLCRVARCRGCRSVLKRRTGWVLVPCAVVRVRCVRWVGRWRLRGDSPPCLRPGGAPTTVSPAPSAPCAIAIGIRRQSLRGHPCTAPYGRHSASRWVVSRGHPGGARRAGPLVLRSPPRAADTRICGWEGTRRGVPAGDEHMHPGCLFCGPARASPEEITPQRPRPPPPHRAAARTTTQPVRRLRTERQPPRAGRAHAGGTRCRTGQPGEGEADGAEPVRQTWARRCSQKPSRSDRRRSAWPRSEIPRRRSASTRSSWS